MEYDYEHKMADNPPRTVLDCVKEMERCNINYLQAVQELIEVSRRCGMGELGSCLEHCRHEMEKGMLWVQAAQAYLENL